MSFRVTGIHHVALKCCGADKFSETVRFYTETLCMEVKRKWDGGIMIDTGAGLIEIFSNGANEREEGAVRHFALSVENVDEAAENVRKAGYPITIEPKDIVIAAEVPFHARIAFCKGPVNEDIELFEEK